MKKIFVLMLIAFMAIGSAFPQTIEDVWMNLRNKSVGKARKAIDAVMVGNENNADAWLMKGNTYLQVYQQDAERMAKDPSYVSRTPDAIFIANEAFYKAITIDPKIEPRTGMLDPISGQALCAEPIYNMAVQAKDNKDYDNAIKYFELASRDFKLAKQNLNAGVAAYQMAHLYKATGDNENYKKTLKEIVKLGYPGPSLYLDLYDVYKEEKDTVNCGKILKTALKNVPAENQADIEGAELEYFAMTGQTEKLISTCDALVEKYATSAPVLAMISNHLVNAGLYEKAESVIEKGLALDANNVDLNYQMASRYFFEAIVNQNQQDALMKSKEGSYSERAEKINELKAAQKPILEKAHEWSEKVYKINPDDPQNNVMLSQIKAKLLLPIPDELKAKVDSYRH